METTQKDTVCVLQTSRNETSYCYVLYNTKEKRCIEQGFGAKGANAERLKEDVQNNYGDIHFIELPWNLKLKSLSPEITNSLAKAKEIVNFDKK